MNLWNDMNFDYTVLTGRALIFLDKKTKQTKKKVTAHAALFESKEMAESAAHNEEDEMWNMS